MSSYKMVQMVIRGFVMLLMGIGLFLNSESQQLNSIGMFFLTGVFGSCLVVSAGLMIEAGLQISNSDPFAESALILMAIFLNLLAGIFAFYDFYDKAGATPEIKINKGFISFMAIGIFLIDVCLVALRGQ